ncbi:HpcH/HpaI aldolase/citrate lyase family protein [Flexithrix dorotheae]|uniref:HpcH/HpaI aldolase/citrate lyase family protein n=1 Tax=Flexithrix dorotheae TaxID=70993 RepID=UPI000361D6BB|nr:CoA ester lyase [Flexithrix dorotheae]
MNYSLRTMFFVPSYMTKFLEKATTLEADALILDLEDSVPNENKPEARENIKNFLDRDAFKQKVFIRVNSIDSNLLSEDLKWTIHENTDGFMFTKIQNEQDIFYFDKLLLQLEADNGFPEGKFKMCPLIETAEAVLRAYEIGISSKRMIGLAFGGEDYLRDLDGLHKEHGTSLLVPRSNIVIAARAAKIEPIDTPYLDIHDLKGFKNEVELARELGFSGSLTIHPSQLKIANKAFSPSDLEIEEAERIIAAIKESEKKGMGVTLLDGKLIGPPMQKRAESVLKKVEKIKRNGVD